MTDLGSILDTPYGPEPHQDCSLSIGIAQKHIREMSLVWKQVGRMYGCVLACSHPHQNCMAQIIPA